ncbi:MAG: TIGR03790 family protein, partial [Candidatus Poseidoniia archaeon]
MGRMRVISVLLMLLMSPWIGSIDESEKPKAHFDLIFDGFVVARSDSWNETPFRDIAVEGGFSQTGYMDYSDVGVLINNQSSASRTIGWAFVAARNISLENVLLFDNESTPTGETINRNQFNQYFVEPFREWLNESEHRRTDINYLVTTKGIPLRVSGGNSKVSFDNELALVEGDMKASIDTDWWVQHSYGPFNGDGFESFTREKHGFFLITRLTGYTVETALGLIEKANNSLGQRGMIVLDLANNRNGSGYKYWNDDLYTANATLNGSMDLPVMFNQNSTFITNVSNVIAYASWGSNDGSWSQNEIPNGGFDNANSSWSSGAEFWNATIPTLSAGDTFNWSYQTDTKKDGNGAVEASISAVCTAKSGSYEPGILAEYFDNNGVSFNTGSMPLLIDRVPDHIRIESNLQYSSSSQAYPGLDNRFKNDWGARFSGLISVPETGNWTFYLTTDDGSELWMDGQSLIQNYGSHGMTEISNSLVLDAGIHDFRIEFFQGGGPHGLQFSWAGPNQSKTFIPASAFTLAGGYVPSASSLLHQWDFEDGSGFFANDSVNSSANLTLNNMNSSNWRTCADGSCL